VPDIKFCGITTFAHAYKRATPIGFTQTDLPAECEVLRLPFGSFRWSKWANPNISPLDDKSQDVLSRSNCLGRLWLDRQRKNPIRNLCGAIEKRVFRNGFFQY
jgi:hypothetical protein